MGFIVRPLGALVFGYIGDKYGRNRTLTIAIVCMAVSCMAGACGSAEGQARGSRLHRPLAPAAPTWHHSQL